MFRTFSLIFVLVFAASVANAQDKIVLLNGQTVEGKITKYEDHAIDYTWEKGKKKKQKTATIEEYRVFSIQKAGEEAQIIYKQDTTIGNYLTENEMRHFIYGQKDASDNYKATAFGVGTFVVTSGLIMFDAQDTENDGSFDREPGFLVVLLPSIGGMAVSAMIPVKINMKHVSDPAYLSEEYYVVGYVRKARFKKVMAALKGYAAGLAVGIGTYLILKP